MLKNTGIALLYLIISLFIPVIFIAALWFSNGIYSGYPAFIGIVIFLIWFIRFVLKKEYSFTVKMICITPSLITFAVVCWTLIPLTQYVFSDDFEEGFEYWDLGNGRVVAVTIHEPPEDMPKREETMVFVHGGPGVYVRDFDREFISGFTQDGFTVVIYDQVGAGRSSLLNVSDYSHKGNVHDLKNILEKIDRPIILFGQSYGTGLLTTFLDLHHSEFDIRKIIFTEPSPLPGVDLNNDDPHFNEKTTKRENIEGPEIFDIIQSPRAALALLLPAGNQFVDQRELIHYVGPDIQRAIISTSYCADYEDQILPFEPQRANLMATFKIRDSFVNTHRPDLRDLNIPILLLLGECSYLPRGYAMEYFEHFTIERSHLIRGVGHILWGTDEGQKMTYQAIMSFIDQTEMPLVNQPTHETRFNFIEKGL